MMRVLVTGCSRGIGRATAEEFARRDHYVVATARRNEGLEGLRVGERLVLDVTDEAAVRAAASRIGPVDVLVNAAGGPLVACPAEAHPMDDARALFDVNFFGAWHAIQAFLPAMREQGRGTIVNVSSVIGRVARPLRAAHSATKYALEALSEVLHYEVRHFGVRVVIVEPGATRKDPGSIQVSLAHLAAPYSELFDQVDRGDRRLAAASAQQEPGVVAKAIVDAVERPDPPLRLVVGNDARTVLAARGSHGDAEFEAKMRTMLGITW